MSLAKSKAETFNRALEDARTSFWSVFSSHFPAFNTGDFPVDASDDFDQSTENAALVWIKYNEPPDRTIRLECYTCCLDRVQSLRQAELGVIWVRCQKCGCERPLNIKDIEQ